MQNKRLKLHSETLRKLDSQELKRAQGGAAGNTGTCLTADCIPSVYHRSCRCEYC